MLEPKTRSILGPLVAGWVLATLSLPAWAEDVIDFEGFREGAVVWEAFSRDGAGPIGVVASNEKFPPERNAAIIFDSSCPPRGRPADCSGDDADLGTPNEAFGGPGRGSGGGHGNRSPLGKVLIVAENLVDRRPADGLIDDPDDEGTLRLNEIRLDFSAFGPVTVHGLAALDVNYVGEPSTVELLDGDGNRVGRSPYDLPLTQDNGVVARVDLGDTPGVMAMVVILRGSGAIDNIAFSRSVEIEALSNGRQADRAGGTDIPWVAVGESVNWTYVVTNPSSAPLEDVVVSDSRGVEITCPKSRLAAGETMECRASGTAIDLASPDLDAPTVTGRCQGRTTSPLYQNVGSVTAVSLGAVVRDSDTSHYCTEAVCARIALRKHDKGPDLRRITEGADVDFQIALGNRCAADLTRIEIVDALAPECSRSFDRLAPNRSAVYTCTVQAVTLERAGVENCRWENEVVATASFGEQTLRATDTSTVEIVGCEPLAGAQPAASGPGAATDETEPPASDRPSDESAEESPGERSDDDSIAADAPVQPERGSTDGRGGLPTGLLLFLLAALVAGGLFAWNRLKAG